MTAPSPSERKVSCTRCWVYVVQADPHKSHSIPSSLCSQMVPQKAAWTSHSHAAYGCDTRLRHIWTCPCSIPSQEDVETPKPSSLSAMSQNPELSPQWPTSYPQHPAFRHVVSSTSKHSVFCGDQKEQNKWLQNAMLPVVDPDEWRNTGMHSNYQHLDMIETTEYQCCIQ